jgi:hypothetical protein
MSEPTSMVGDGDEDQSLAIPCSTRLEIPGHTIERYLGVVSGPDRSERWHRQGGVEFAQPPSEHEPDLAVIDPQLDQRVLQGSDHSLNLEGGVDCRRRVEAEHPGTTGPDRRHAIDGPQVHAALRPAGGRFRQHFMLEEAEFTNSSASCAIGVRVRD